MAIHSITPNGIIISQVDQMFMHDHIPYKMALETRDYIWETYGVTRCYFDRTSSAYDRLLRRPSTNHARRLLIDQITEWFTLGPADAYGMGVWTQLKLDKLLANDRRLKGIYANWCYLKYITGEIE